MLVSLIFTVTASSARAAERFPESMGSIGESISAGALAGFDRRDALNPFKIAWLLGLGAELAITRKFSAIEFHGFSWTSGLDPRMRVDSHAQRLKFFSQHFGSGRFAVKEAAMSAKDSSTIMKQYESIREWSRSALGRSAPEYLVFMVGANDACAKTNEEMTPVDVYEARVRALLDQIQVDSPDTRVLISSVPDVGHLRDIAQKASWGAGKCTAAWKTHQFCNNILLQKDPALRKAAEERLAAYDIVLRRLAAEYGARGALLRYSGGVKQIRFEANDISVDCFHPNRHGQEMIAEATWKDGWWKDLPPDYEEAYQYYKKTKRNGR